MQALYFGAEMLENLHVLDVGGDLPLVLMVESPFNELDCSMERGVVEILHQNEVVGDLHQTECLHELLQILVDF